MIIELVVQYPDGPGYYRRRFGGLRLARPVWLVFDGPTTVDKGVASRIGGAFCDEVLRFVGAGEDAGSGQMSHLGVEDHHWDAAACRKIFVRVGANENSQPHVQSTPNAEPLWLAHLGERDWEVLPAMPAGAHVPTHVPKPWQGINVSFWAHNPTDSLWAVLQRVGLSPEENRVFISYVRKDTSPVADQLFQALTDQGFDVFLDRCSVPVGVPFQERLMQDLCDKAMVVLLNSDGVQGSRWVGEEIAIVKAYRLGLLELRFPGGKIRRDIDPDSTEAISDGDQEPAGAPYENNAKKLSQDRLTQVVARIKDTHGRALHRQRYQLIDNFAAALAAANKPATLLPDGSFVLPATSARPEVLVSLSSRPPELGDFCGLHLRGSISPCRAGWIISPCPFFLAYRQVHVSWLGKICNIRHADEAQLMHLAANL